MTNTIYLGAIKGVVEMAEHLGKQDIADKYRALYEKASVLVDEKLFNGEYYTQELEDVDAYRYQYGIGCLYRSAPWPVHGSGSRTWICASKGTCKESFAVYL